MKGADPDNPVKQRTYSCAWRLGTKESVSEESIGKIMDAIEMGLWGGVKREELECRCKSIFELYQSFAASIEGDNISTARRKRPILPGCPDL